MEQEIANILKESALDEKKQMELEDLEMNAISKEEMIARRQELAKLRSLAFYAEQKAKKVAKIKSKTYRKIHRKADERKAAKDGKNLSLEELKELDPDAAREQAEKLHTDRIKERMTQKHKSTGKWARKMLSRNDQDDQTRQALMNQLNQSHELTRKIAGLDSDQDSDDLNPASDDEVGGGAAHARTRLHDLDAEVKEDAASMDVPTKGLYAMKFMQKGLEGQMKKSREVIGRALEAFGEEVDDGYGEEEDEREARRRRQDAKEKVKASLGGVGRIVFGGGADDDDDDADLEMGDEQERDDSVKVSSGQFSMKVATPISVIVKSKMGSQKFAVEYDDENRPAMKIKNADFKEPVMSSSAKPSKQAKSKPVESASKGSVSTEENTPLLFDDTADDNEASNPWLTASASTAKKTTKLNLSHSDKAMDKMNRVKQQRKNAELASDLGVILNLDGVRKLETVKTQHVPVSVAVKNLTTLVPDEEGHDGANGAEPVQYGPVAPRRPVISYDSDQDSDPEVQYEKVSKNFVHAADIGSLTQRELMQIAFAGDNVAAEFEDEKERIMEADAPKIVDETLPGWVSFFT
ncbi:Utp14 protein-domain-containing protein [Chytriomyces sp. MP71]|nr:Utp14 protein-domain-containing protein [Chytriomyces sp. MP71]